MIKVYLAGGMRERPVQYKSEAGYLFAQGKYIRKSWSDGEFLNSTAFTSDAHWQNIIEDNFSSKNLNNFSFLNPIKNDIKNEFDQYSTLDLFHVKASDIVFGYLEATNPAGHGMAVEMGYAKGSGKTVILVNETKLDDPMYRYKKFIEKSADIVFTNFVDGVLFLERFQG